MDDDDNRGYESCITATSSCQWLLMTAGTIAFIIPAAIYGYRVGTSTRPVDVDTFNTAMTSWASGTAAGQSAFSSLSGMTVSTLTSTPVPLQPVTGAAAISAASAPLIQQPDVLPYPPSSAIVYTGLLNSAAFPAVIGWSGNTLTTNVTISLPADAFNASLTIPYAFTTTYNAKCTTEVDGSTPTCTCPFGQLSGNTCRVWAIATGLCLAVTATTTPSRSITPYVTDVIGGGCFPLPGLNYAPLKVPAVDSCVPLGSRSMSPMQYALYGNLPSIVNVTSFTVNVRAGSDPYVLAGYATYGAFDYGPPLDAAIALRNGLFIAFAICASLLLCTIVCSWKPCADAAEAGVRSENAYMAGAAEYTVRMNRCIQGTFSCSGVQASSVSMGVAAGVCFLAYVIMAFILFQSEWACAYRSVCGGNGVLVTCGTFNDLKASSSDGAVFANLAIAALALAFGPAMIACGCCSAMLYVRLGDGKLLVIILAMVLGTYVIAFPLALALQLASLLYFQAYNDTIMAGYCAFVSARVGVANLCKPSPSTQRLYLADTVIGVTTLALMCCAGCVVVGAKLRERVRAALQAARQRAGIAPPADVQVVAPWA